MSDTLKVKRGKKKPPTKYFVEPYLVEICVSHEKGEERIDLEEIADKYLIGMTGHVMEVDGHRVSCTQVKAVRFFSPPRPIKKVRKATTNVNGRKGASKKRA